MEQERLTNGLHDELWIKGARAIQSIDNTLKQVERATRVSNAIACAKELRAIGEISHQDYKESLLRFLGDSGYKMNP
jgi:hypothetical protein